MAFNWSFKQALPCADLWSGVSQGLWILGGFGLLARLDGVRKCSCLSYARISAGALQLLCYIFLVARHSRKGPNFEVIVEFTVTSMFEFPLLMHITPQV